MIFVHSFITCCQTVTDDAVLLWAQRAQCDFEKKVGKNAPAKQKARHDMIWVII